MLRMILRPEDETFCIALEPINYLWLYHGPENRRYRCTRKVYDSLGSQGRFH